MKRILSSLLVLAMIICSSAITATAFPEWNGDANGDGAVNARDAALLQQYLADWDVVLGPTA